MSVEPGDRVWVLGHINGWRVVQLHWCPWIFRFGIVFNLPRTGVVRRVNAFGAYEVVFPSVRWNKMRLLSTGLLTKDYKCIRLTYQ